MVAEQFILAAADPAEHVMPHTLFHIGGMEVTNQMVMALIAAILVAGMMLWAFREPSGDAPSGLRNALETVLEFLRNDVFRPILKDHTDRFVPFLWTLFFFILFCNLLGQIPINELWTIFTTKEIHFGATATGTAITTGTLAVIVFFTMHVSGVIQCARNLIDGTHGHHEHKEHGHGDPGPEPEFEPPEEEHHFRKERHMSVGAAVTLAVPLYLWNFAPHVFKPQEGQTKLLWIADVFMWAILLVLELAGAIIKPLALTLRLFANMIAGHIVLAALVLLIPLSATFLHQIGVAIPVVILSLMIRMLELLVAFLQAYIFTFLTTMFIAGSVAPEH